MHVHTAQADSTTAAPHCDPPEAGQGEASQAAKLRERQQVCVAAGCRARQVNRAQLQVRQGGWKVRGQAAFDFASLAATSRVSSSAIDTKIVTSAHLWQAISCPHQAAWQRRREHVGGQSGGLVPAGASDQGPQR